MNYMEPNIQPRASKTLASLYQAVSKKWAGFAARPGQREMMDVALRTMLQSKEEGDERDGANIACIEGKTGTGKTLGYLLPAIAVAEATGMTVVVSTATVALQEQLFYRDVPRLAAISPIPFDYKLLKGRNRYVCHDKLEQQLIGAVQGSVLEPDDEAENAPVQQQEVKILKNLMQTLTDERWDGDRDTLKEAPPEQLWGRIQNDTNTCLRRHCAYFKECTYFKARRLASKANIVLANHDLVLSVLTGGSGLFDPRKTIFVFDEAHHLCDIALERFKFTYNLNASIRLLNGLRGPLARAGAVVPAAMPSIETASEHAEQVGIHSRNLSRSLAAYAPLADRPHVRFANGVLPEAFQTMSGDMLVHLEKLAESIQSLTESVKTKVEDAASANEKMLAAKALQELMPPVQRVVEMFELWTGWAENGRVPKAKWIERSVHKGKVEYTLACSDLTAAATLSRHLWKSARAVVLTSATLTACGSFDFFAKQAGLKRLPRVNYLAVESPFEYEKQGEIVVPNMRSTPKASEQHTSEISEVLPALLDSHEKGQLVLFTSKKQMQAVYDALPPALKDRVLVQGALPRQKLLEQHIARVKAGERSILFGLQSMGEGIDLPGQLCEHVLIAKIPFAPPDSPVEEALSEWLQGQNRDPFAEITVPKAGQKLAQWVGRGIRTIEDRARITILDTRLTSQRYGKVILRGLPPLPLIFS